MEKAYIYFVTNYKKTVIYTGVTSDLVKRINEHKQGIGCLFTNKYNCDRIVYYEVFSSINDAIHREKQLKKWKRKWKDELIEKVNPQWNDLSVGMTSNPIE